MLRAHRDEKHFVEKDIPPYMLLSWGSLNLIINQCEVISVEGLGEIDSDSPLQGSIGWLGYDNRKIPVYSLSDKFDLQRTVPSDRTICAVIQQDSAVIALTCSDAVNFKRNVIKQVPLPQCMHSVSSPIDTICLYRGNNCTEVMFVGSAESLIDYVSNANRP